MFRSLASIKLNMDAVSLIWAKTDSYSLSQVLIKYFPAFPMAQNSTERSEGDRVQVHEVTFFTTNRLEP